MFSTLSTTEIIIFVTFNLSSANAFNLVWSKTLSCGKELTLYQTTKFLDLTKLKALADDKLYLVHIMRCTFDSFENIVVKGEMRVSNTLTSQSRKNEGKELRFEE